MVLTFDGGEKDPVEFRSYVCGILLRDCHAKRTRAALLRARDAFDNEEMRKTEEEAEALEAEAVLIKDAVSTAMFHHSDR
jgi:hypothetical protein